MNTSSIDFSISEARKARLRVVFLVGSDSSSTRKSIEAVCGLEGLELAGILLDTSRPTLGRRWKNFFKTVRRKGLTYAVRRMAEALDSFAANAVERTGASKAEVQAILRQAFPEENFSLNDLAKRFNFQIYEVGNLNEARAVQTLSHCEADLGIVIGTRILKPQIFTVPKLGCINLHKGKVPEFRGMPPGFWELYEGASSAGITVHRVDKGLDTGEIIATSSFPIDKTDTPESLLEKLHLEGARTLATAVAKIRDGDAKFEKQEKTSAKARTKPTEAEILALRQRLTHWSTRSLGGSILRNSYLLFVYYSGIYFIVKQWHRMSRTRASIFLYHRVNDYSKDPLTVDRRTFTAHLLALSRRYQILRSEELVERLRRNQPVPPTAILIHFDDCYRDVYLNGGRILKIIGAPACAFINSGYVDTDRTFPHDSAKYPFQFPMLRVSDIQAWSDQGLEVGAHTVNHVDLSKCTPQEANFEIIKCGEDLTQIIGRPVKLFSFPFGRQRNITESAREIVKRAGYSAMFSAYGGTVNHRTDLFDIPRAGAHWELPPLYCLLQVEGLTLTQLTSKIRNRGMRGKGREDRKLGTPASE